MGQSNGYYSESVDLVRVAGPSTSVGVTASSGEGLKGESSVQTKPACSPIEPGKEN
jgi:hypothetical protein